MTGSHQASRGFSLLEISIAMLVMGLSVSGLLTLMQYGQLRYGALDSGWRYRQEIDRLHRFFRSAVARGDPLETLVAPPRPEPTGGVRLASWTWAAQPPDSVFVQARLYEDRNRNGREEVAERISPQVWVFRVRSER